MVQYSGQYQGPVQQASMLRDLGGGPRQISPSLDSIARSIGQIPDGTPQWLQAANTGTIAGAAGAGAGAAGGGVITDSIKALATAPPAAAAAPAPSTHSGISLSGANRQGFVDLLFDAGVAQGDRNYWYEQQADDADLTAAAVRGLSDPTQRKAIVDYLFDSGLASGNREYWYENRGAEDADLISTFARAGGGAAGGSTVGKDIDTLREERLAAAIAAIGAEFDYQEGDLGAQIQALKDFFKSETAKNDRESEYAQEAIVDNSVERGIYRSGITAKNLARGLVPFQENRASLIGQYNPTEGAEGSEIRRIMSAIELLKQQEASATASAERDSEQEELDLAKLIELIGAGLA